MARPFLTIGMAHHSDFHGVYFTLQSLRMHHSVQDVEFVLVDNSPQGPEAPMIRRLLENCQSGTAGTKYVPLDNTYGTSASRNRIFDEASGEHVLVMDCHVLLFPGALNSLIKYYRDHPGTDNLLSGPLVMDNMQGICTHYDNVWQAEMWGIWGRAWKCGCGPNGQVFATGESEGKLAVYSLDMNRTPLSACKSCGEHFPEVGYAGHEVHLVEQGFKPLGFEDGPAFDIPGMGLGLFSCRRDAWLGFNEFARGFGGEELYIHEKFRLAGRRCLCLPRLKWLHRFARPEGVKYPLTRFNKVRNYVLEFNELGRPLDEVHGHFVAPGLMSQSTWDKLIANPIQATEQNCGSCGVSNEQSSGIESVDQVFDTLVATPRDLNEHMPYLKYLASKVDRVTEISGRRESAIAFLAAKPKRFMSHNTENTDPFLNGLKDVSEVEWTKTAMRAEHLTEIEKTDLLFLDDKHTYAAILHQLQTYSPQVSRYIVIHDTDIYGEKGEDGGRGMSYAIVEFMQQQPEWFIADRNVVQYGLVVLSRLEEDQPDVPIVLIDVGHGPGTELKAILASLDINPSVKCDCNQKAQAMDYWGVEGCKERRDKIIDWLRDGQERWGWKNKLGAGLKAIASGLAFKLNWTDPFPGLVDECIHRAEQKEQNQ